MKWMKIECLMKFEWNVIRNWKERVVEWAIDEWANGACWNWEWMIPEGN